MTNHHPNCVIRIPAKDTFSTSGPSLMGRQSANEGFLKAWFSYSGHQEFWCMARYRSEAETFARLGESVDADRARTSVYRWVPQNLIHRAAAIGSVYVPGPQVADISWIRRRDTKVRAADFSIVGMTHTSCELPIQDALANMLTAPVYDWDAQICPSHSVHTMVKRLLDDEAAWLSEHLNAKRIIQPQLPIIPIGVDCNWFAPESKIKNDHRQHWRARWQLQEGDVCVLYMGRLDLRTKANLFPMLDALELAAQRLKREASSALVLVLAGWFATESDEKTIREAIATVCSNYRVIVEDGRPLDARRGLWHAADIFTSLVDNIQETFGLTPIEAMAAGLPVVVSDYDGYRESVRHGIDGYRVPTIQPPAGAGIDLIDGHADVMMSYQDYVGQASAMIGINMQAAADAFFNLATNPSLRKQMGAEGQKRAREHYDWAMLIPRYMELLNDLEQARQLARNLDRDWTGNLASADFGARNPRRSDPFHSFKHYASDVVGLETRLYPGPLFLADKNARSSLLRSQLERPVYQVVRPHLYLETLESLLDMVASQPQGLRLGSFATSHASIEDSSGWLRQVGWLVKAGFVVN